MNIFKSWFKSKPIQNIPRNCVFFDGDNNHIVPVIKISSDRAWDHKWVINSKASIPKKILNLKHVEKFNPSNLGKESSDTFIAMDVVRLSAQGVKRVVIVSNDADFLDVIINASKMFPGTDYTLMIHRGGAGIRKISNLSLPNNAKIVYFHSK